MAKYLTKTNIALVLSVLLNVLNNVGAVSPASDLVTKSDCPACLVCPEQPAASR